MAQNINMVALTGNLTKDPESHEVGSTSVVSLRLAVNGSKKNQQGVWEDKPNYFDVNVWGAQGESCMKYLSKGRPVAVNGRLEWSEWEKDGKKNQAVRVVANQIQFLGNGDTGGSSPQHDVKVDMGGLETPTKTVITDDIPF